MASLVEGETGTSDTVDATRSGGKYHAYTVPAGTTGVDVVATSAALSAIKTGAWLRFILVAAPLGSVKASPFIRLTGITYYGPSSAFADDGSHWRAYDLGMVWMPPGSFNVDLDSGFKDLQVGIHFVSTGGATANVDYFLCTPVDSFARAVIDYGSVKTVLDCFTGQALGNNQTANDQIYAFGTLYGGIYLEPALAQRLLLKFYGTTDDPSNYCTVYLNCWARKKTL